jgi:hypothetical protein
VRDEASGAYILKKTGVEKLINLKKYACANNSNAKQLCCPGRWFSRLDSINPDHRSLGAIGSNKAIRPKSDSETRQSQRQATNKRPDIAPLQYTAPSAQGSSIR